MSKNLQNVSPGRAWLIAQTLTDNTSGFSSRKSKSSQSGLNICTIKVWLIYVPCWKSRLKDFCCNLFPIVKSWLLEENHQTRFVLLTRAHLQLLSKFQCDVILLLCYNYVYILCTYRPYGVAMATCKVPTMSRRLWSNDSSSRPWLPNWCPPEAPFS